MPRAKHSEMSTIQCCKLSLPEALHDSEDGGVDKAQVLIGIAIHQLADSGVVSQQQVHHDIRTSLHVTHQSEHRRRAHPLRDEVVELGQNRARDHQSLVALLDQTTAASVVTISAVQRRVERAGVEDQRHVRGGWRWEPRIAAVRDGDD